MKNSKLILYLIALIFITIAIIDLYKNGFWLEQEIVSGVVVQEEGLNLAPIIFIGIGAIAGIFGIVIKNEIKK